MRWTATLGASALVGLFVGCGEQASIDPAADRGAESVDTAHSPAAVRPIANGHNLLLVTLDTVRTDHLGCYGSTKANTPVLDELAQEGTLFEQAYSPAPMTLPVHATLLSGVLPPQHGARVNGEHRLGEDVPTLAEELSVAGYRTAAFVAAFVLNERFGLGRGFDHYDDDLTDAYEQEVPSALARYRPGDRVVDAALEWLATPDAPTASSEQPFFAWVHLYDAHYPWFSHDEGVEPTPGSGSYRGEVEFVDQQVGRLLAFLDERGLRENTIVVAVADHGEGLGDHGEIEHAYLLNDEVLHVPFLMSGPGVESGHRVSSLVALEDVRPTVNELLALPVPQTVRGRSLARALRGEAIEAGVSYAETDLPYTAFRWSPQRSLTTEEWKYIRTPQPELYDRTSDRSERINLVEVRPEVHAKLEAQLAMLEAELEVRDSSAVDLSAAERARLEALGYSVGGNGAAPATSDVVLADVKERLPAKHLAADLRRLQAQPNPDPQLVAQMAAELVRMSPETPSFYVELGDALLRTGAAEEGLRALATAVDLLPDDVPLRYRFGDALQQHGYVEQARQELERVLQSDPSMASAQVAMGNVLRSEGRADLAAGRYAEALRLTDGDYPEAHYNLALTYLDRGDGNRAEEHFRQALTQRPDWLLAHRTLARLLADTGWTDRAIAQFEKAIEIAPQDVDLRCDLGLLFASQSAWPEATAHWRIAVELAPQFFRPHLFLADRAFDEGDDEFALRSYEEALRLAPGVGRPTARLARFLATCPRAELRDGERAVALAARAVDLLGADPRVLDTLAAAQAETGDFAGALTTAHRAQQLARSREDESLFAAIEARIALYALEQPYHRDRDVVTSAASNRVPTTPAEPAIAGGQ